MAGNENAVFKYPQLGHVMLHLQRAAPGGVRHGIEIAADGDHAFLGNTPLDSQHRAVRVGRQRLKRRVLKLNP